MRARGGRKKKWVAAGIVTVLVAGGGATAWALTRPTPAASVAGTTLVAATVSTMTQSVVATGTIQPARRSDLSFPVAGKVTRVAATVGQTVVKGRVLATVDATTLKTSLDTASAAVTSAKEEVSALAASTTTTATQTAAGKAQLALAQSQLAAAKDNLAAASLKAPFSGVVAAVSMAVGDTVGSGSGGSSGARTTTTTTTAASTGVITVISTDAWVVDANVGSSDLASLKKGLQAQITPTGSATRIFGTIDSIGIVAATSSAGSATFPVVVDVTGSPAGVYAGATADVSFIVSQVPNVLTVPTIALHSIDGGTVVYQQKNGQQVNTPVTVGTAYGPVTEITKGLAEGDQVAVSFGGGGRVPTGTRTGTRGGGTGFGGTGNGGTGFGGTGNGGTGFGGTGNGGFGFGGTG